MSKASAARRLAAAAAFGGGGLGLVGGSLYGVLRAEAALARRKIGKAVGKPPDPTGLYGAHLPGPAVRLAVLGDSGAAGYGAEAPEETFGAFLAAGLSELAARPVFLDSVALIGAQTAG
ncbi:MAG: SGNH/GDSL hydrolase family protein, partial [Actinomycetota bacterium]|nr:SGNH/GDSL hydrolase family protein [Actinomycetota bacterium]